MPYKDKEENKKYFQEYYKKNKSILDEYRKEYRASNKELEKIWQDNYRKNSVRKRRQYVIKSRYGLSEDDYQKMLVNQDNRCACCGGVFIKTPHIDHCHTTGRVRGLLCAKCNTGLGVYEKNKELFERYLNG